MRTISMGRGGTRSLALENSTRKSDAIEAARTRTRPPATRSTAASFVSLGLGVVSLLPIPWFDGGQVAHRISFYLQSFKCGGGRGIRTPTIFKIIRAFQNQATNRFSRSAQKPRTTHVIHTPLV